MHSDMEANLHLMKRTHKMYNPNVTLVCVTL
jgi:hypothetical protein